MIYHVTEDLMFKEEIGEYLSYGIELRNGETIVDIIRDIDTDGESVRRLCELCNELELSALHFRDVVEDYLAK